MGSSLGVQVFKHGKLFAWNSFQETVWIGSKSSNDFVLEGLESEHSFLEYQDGVWCVTAIASATVRLNGVKVRRAVLPTARCVLTFNEDTPWQIRLTVEPESLEVNEPESHNPPHHHQETFENLVDELMDLGDDVADVLLRMKAMWPALDEDKKRERLRTLVAMVRETRTKGASRTLPRSWMVTLEVADGSPVPPTWMVDLFALRRETLEKVLIDYLDTLMRKRSAAAFLNDAMHAGLPEDCLKGAETLAERTQTEMQDIALRMTVGLARLGGRTWEQQQSLLQDAWENRES